jgi:small subunit ribosomal protein S4
VDIASFLVKVGDIVAVAEKSKSSPLLKENMEVASSRAIPEWLSLNSEKMEGSIVSLPLREQIDSPVNEQLVIEFYAR